MTGPTNLTPASLRHCVRVYRQSDRPRHAAYLRRFAEMPWLPDAIRAAARAENEDGKCESHQRRVGRATLVRWERKLQGKRRQIRACRTFEALHNLLLSLRIQGIGALAVYDTAVRIGAFLELEPEVVYLHAGTRTGAKALGLDVSRGVLRREDLPAPLLKLSCAELEDFLCSYRHAFVLGDESRAPKGCGHPGLAGADAVLILAHCLEGRRLLPHGPLDPA